MTMVEVHKKYGICCPPSAHLLADRKGNNQIDSFSFLRQTCVICSNDIFDTILHSVGSKSLPNPFAKGMYCCEIRSLCVVELGINCCRIFVFK